MSEQSPQFDRGLPQGVVYGLWWGNGKRLDGRCFLLRSCHQDGGLLLRQDRSLQLRQAGYLVFSLYGDRNQSLELLSQKSRAQNCRKFGRQSSCESCRIVRTLESEQSLSLTRMSESLSLNRVCVSTKSESQQSLSLNTVRM